MDYKNVKIPNHVALIVDGNGRWATERGLSRLEGHDAGLKNLKDIVKYIFSKEIKYLSIYVFSTENFKRSSEEVTHLMQLFINLFKDGKDFFMNNNIKVIFSGRNEPLPSSVIVARNKLAKITEKNTGGVLNVCLNYGGRSEIVDATKRIMKDNINPNDITEELFKEYLYQNLPDVDLMIRTSGELRISNFLLWQLSYAEFYFTKVKFPDFKSSDFDDAILEYTKRDRRFGKN